MFALIYCSLIAYAAQLEHAEGGVAAANNTNLHYLLKAQTQLFARFPTYVPFRYYNGFGTLLALLDVNRSSAGRAPDGTFADLRARAKEEGGEGGGA